MGQRTGGVYPRQPLACSPELVQLTQPRQCRTERERTFGLPVTVPIAASLWVIAVPRVGPPHVSIHVSGFVFNHFQVGASLTQPMLKTPLA